MGSLIRNIKFDKLDNFSRIIKHNVALLGSTKKLYSTDEKKDSQDDLYRYLEVKCSAHEPYILDSYEKFLKESAEHLDIKYLKTETPFRTIKRRTLLASRFVKKKYRVQYELRTHYRNLLFTNLTGSTLSTYLEYVERNIPEGVHFIAEKHKLEVLPFELEQRTQTEL